MFTWQQLRAKLRTVCAETWIETVRSRGYRFVGDVELERA